MQLSTEQKLKKAVKGLAKGASLNGKTPYNGHPIYVPEANETIIESREICHYISSIIHESVILQFNGKYYALNEKNYVALKSQM